MKIFVLNGKHIRENAIPLVHWQRAAYYGDGLFETIRICNHEPLFVEEHFERMWKGCQVLSIPARKQSLEKDFFTAIHQLLSKTSVLHARIRISLFRGGEGYYTPQKSFYSLLGELEALRTDPYTVQQEKTATVLHGIQKPVNIFSGIKSLNAQFYTYAGIAAQQQGADQAIILNEKGNVCEFTSSNIFIFKKKWITPPLSEGCMDGVMRKQLIRHFQSHHIPFAEKKIKPKDLKKASTIIGTNVISGITSYSLGSEI